MVYAAWVEKRTVQFSPRVSAGPSLLGPCRTKRGTSPTRQFLKSEVYTSDSMKKDERPGQSKLAFRGFGLGRWNMIFYNGEFDPGSGWTLATGLTHASRGETTSKACFWWASTGARVSNAYPTCPPLGDNLAKVRLIPNDISRRHQKEIKDLSVMDGDASD